MAFDKVAVIQYGPIFYLQNQQKKSIKRFKEVIEKQNKKKLC